MTLQQAENSLVEKLVRHTPVNNNQEARPEEIRSIITSMSPLAKASLFNYVMPANRHWVNLSAKQIVSALGDAPAYLLSLIGYGTLNRFSIMDNEDIGREELTQHISIKDRLNLAMVAKQIDLVAAPLNPQSKHHKDWSSKYQT